MRKFRLAIIDTALLLVAVAVIVVVVVVSDVAAGEANAGATVTVVGDMLLSGDQLNYLYATDEATRPSNPFERWPNATLFYKFDKSLDQAARSTVINAMGYIANVSCVRFVEGECQSGHYVLIKRSDGCSAEVGMRRSGPQQMIIDGNLCTKGSVIHELLHCLGFLHMHMASGRDRFIDINWDNVRDGAQLNFKSFTTHVNTFNTEYDYDSITHYGSNAFAKNKSMPTIVAKRAAPRMGQRREMSHGDIVRLNRMYCDERNDDDDDTSESELQDDNSDEDDMILSKEQIEAMYSLGSAKRNGYAKAFHHWPRGVVPFEIDPSFGPNYVSSIYEAMNHIMNRSCIQFVPRGPHDQNFIYIMPPPHPGGGCSSEVGMRGSGAQSLQLNETLCSRGKVIHELLHSLGFFHMHTANDRDNYIRINWENIRENAKGNFIQMNMHVSMFSTPYDYESIMHYSSFAFAKNRNRRTIVPLAPATDMGQRRGLSKGDIVRLNRMYKCRGTAVVATATTETATSTSAPDTASETSPKTLLGMLIFKIVGKN